MKIPAQRSSTALLHSKMLDCPIWWPLSHVPFMSNKLMFHSVALKQSLLPWQYLILIRHTNLVTLWSTDLNLNLVKKKKTMNNMILFTANCQQCCTVWSTCDISSSLHLLWMIICFLDDWPGSWERERGSDWRGIVTGAVIWVLSQFLQPCSRLIC